MSEEGKTQELLEKHGLKKTRIRLDVLRQFINYDFALSHQDLENKLDKKYDRVTLYRTLNSFEENGLIHKVPDENNVSRFALCHADCSALNHQDHHVHFICNACHHTYCLDDIAVPKVDLPDTFSIARMELTVNGICNQCNVA
ncbi:transcriptional repressor [Fulvivirgaceae bacterium BMA10]|uniref:Transcriptional repressor n=1 Tax=Splendidivirga corallicola TaxID=3051826 RepID=A0ABT8KXV6_9BACT|nr:transcriptional repressor [Fulvivirgaceae bacterium BMA10]